MDHPLPWLRYVDADDLDDDTVDFDGLKVRNAQMETLGSVEGFIVDSQTARPYYVVVDSGGWFKSRHYLLPVGHARMDDDNDALVVDLAKDRIDRFPGFDRDKFEKLSEDELKRFNDETCNACSLTVVSYSAADPFESQWERPHYAQPSWWTSDSSSTRRAADDAAFVAGAEYPPSKAAPSSSESRARASGESSERPYQAQQGSVTAGRNDDSPFFEGRAQPGDVIGLDTGGEQTHVGETAEDENKRREAAEEAVKKARS